MKSIHTMIRGIFPLVLLGLLTACGSKPGTGETRGAEGRAEDAHAKEGEAEAHADDAHAEGEGAHEEGPPSTSIPMATAKSAGIRAVPAGSGMIADEHEVQGLLTPPEGRIAHVMARFPGPIRSLRANIGDKVRAGQTLATIESNLSLTTYAVPSPISGVVLQRTASVGAVAGEGMALYEVADLSQLWVDLHIFGADAGHITAGIPVTVTRISDGVSAETTLERILPGTATASQSTVARATIDNNDGLWRPGAAVRARITVDTADAALIVPLTALQTDEGNRDVVYIREGERYQERAVTLGRRDARNVQVAAGLRAGEQVVIAQSFLVKADIGKSSAEHEH
ncbi:MAG: efflux RND transporter periplasmic adaptor subunit [Pseudoxanthomonas sp.]